MAQATDPFDVTPDSSQVYQYFQRISMASPGGIGDVEFVYLKGCASTVVGSWVTYDTTGATTLLTANAVGLVAVAMSAANSTSKWGWYQVKGINTVAISDTTAANQALYIDATPGRVDDAAVAGDLVLNAFSTASDTTNVLPVYINYPSVNNILG